MNGEEDLTIRQIPLKYGKFVVGIAVTRKWILVMHDGNPNIWGYAAIDGEFGKSVNVPDLQPPRGFGTIVAIPCSNDSKGNRHCRCYNIVSTSSNGVDTSTSPEDVPDDDVIAPADDVDMTSQQEDEDHTRVCVIDCGGSAMHFLTLTHDLEIHQHQIIELDYGPQSVTLSRSPGGELVTTEFGSPLVRTYDHHGIETNQHTAPHEDGSIPGCAVKLRSGEYVTPESRSGSLVWSDATGLRLRSYFSAQNPLSKPQYLAEDAYGDVMVTYRHGVMLVDRNGAYVRDVVKNGEVRLPYCLHIDPTGRLIYVPVNSVGGVKIKVIAYEPRGGNEGDGGGGGEVDDDVSMDPLSLE